MAGVTAYLATAVLGLLSGAMLLIALAIAPFWSALPPSEFADWFRDYSPLLGRVMIPLGAVATLLSLLTAALTRPLGSSGSRLWVAAAALAVVVAAVYPLYFGAANAAIASGSLSPDQVSAELGRWRT